MWSTSNDYGLSNIGGERPLGDYSEIAEHIKLIYQLAQNLGIDGKIFAQIDPANEVYKLGQGDTAAALAYGLKPYLIAPMYSPQDLTGNELPETPTLNKNMPRTMLRSILHNIVEES